MVVRYGSREIRKAADPGSGSAAWRLLWLLVSTAGRSPGTGPREVGLGEAHVCLDGTRRAGDGGLADDGRRDGAGIGGAHGHTEGVAGNGHAEGRRGLSRLPELDAVHGATSFVLSGADLAGIECAGLLVRETYRPLRVMGKGFNGHF